MKYILFIFITAILVHIIYEVGKVSGKNQIINQIGGKKVYNSLSIPIWIDTIYDYRTNDKHFDTIQTYVVTCGKYNGEETLYYVDLPDGYALDNLTKIELDTILMGKSLTI